MAQRCECAAGCRTQIKQNRGPQAKNSRAWSTGNLHCIHLTHRHQVLKMQLHSTDGSWVQCLTEHRRETLQPLCWHTADCTKNSWSPRGKTAKGTNNTVVMCPDLGTQHYPNSIIQDRLQTCLFLLILQLSNRLCYPGEHVVRRLGSFLTSVQHPRYFSGIIWDYLPCAWMYLHAYMIAC